MDLAWSDVIIPAVVAVVLVPGVQYLLNRRERIGRAAYQARVGYYEEMLDFLQKYLIFVKTLPNEPTVTWDDDDVNRLERLIRLHASPKLLALIQELKFAIEESKSQAFGMTGLINGARMNQNRTERQIEFSEYLIGQHATRKKAAEEWADEAFKRVRDRMRFELYGWRPYGPVHRFRSRQTAKKIAGTTSRDLFGGVDHSKIPDRMQQRWDKEDAAKADRAETT